MSLSFRVRLWPTLGMVLVVGVTGALGVWQVQRHGQQHDRLSVLEERLAAPPVTTLEGDWDALAWRRAALQGRFEGEPALVSAVSRGRHGYDLVQPLRLDDGTRVLVDRGWIPADDWSTHLEHTRPEGRVALSGLLRRIEGGDDLAPLPATGGRPSMWPRETTPYLRWFTRIVGTPWASLAAAEGEVAGVALVVGPGHRDGQTPPPGPLPVSGYVAEPYRIGHVKYAAQWFGIAALMFGVWVWVSLGAPGVRAASRT